MQHWAGRKCLYSISGVRNLINTVNKIHSNDQSMSYAYRLMIDYCVKLENRCCIIDIHVHVLTGTDFKEEVLFFFACEEGPRGSIGFL